jgi:cobalt/nickel transport protein
MKIFKVNISRFFFIYLFIPGILLNPVFPESTGTDEKAIELINEINTNYNPWFKPIWSPPKEVENLIFTLQAALGAGIIGYFVGFYKGKKSQNNKPG